MGPLVARLRPTRVELTTIEGDAGEGTYSVACKNAEHEIVKTRTRFETIRFADQTASHAPHVVRYLGRVFDTVLKKWIFEQRRIRPAMQSLSGLQHGKGIDE
jgi:hypothetical protein